MQDSSAARSATPGEWEIRGMCLHTANVLVAAAVAQWAVGSGATLMDAQGIFTSPEPPGDSCLESTLGLGGPLHRRPLPTLDEV